MPGFDWKPYGDNLMLREDEFSWQGAHPSDKRFFLRRSKNNPEHFTDLLVGSLEPSEVAMVLNQFLEVTGGIGRRLVLIAFADDSLSNDLVVEKFDRLSGIVRDAAEISQIETTNVLLQPSRMKWDAVIETKPAA